MTPDCVWWEYLEDAPDGRYIIVALGRSRREPALRFFRKLGTEQTPEALRVQSALARYDFAQLLRGVAGKLERSVLDTLPHYRGSRPPPSAASNRAVPALRLVLSEEDRS